MLTRTFAGIGWAFLLLWRAFGRYCQPHDMTKAGASNLRPLSLPTESARVESSRYLN